MKTQIILVRHGEPRYDEVLEKGYVGMGYDLGKLTDKGSLQAEERALDPLLQDAELIVSSPYTRALQTAAIISRITQIPLTVENDLHEWMPDVKFRFKFVGDEPFIDYLKHNGKRSDDHHLQWETYAALKKRVSAVLIKYKKYRKIIVVCHGIVMSAMTHFDDVIEHCGVREIKL